MALHLGPDIDQLIRMWIRQRREQRRVNHGEDRGVRADTKRDCEQEGDSQPKALAPRPQTSPLTEPRPSGSGDVLHVGYYEAIYKGVEIEMELRQLTHGYRKSDSTIIKHPQGAKTIHHGDKELPSMTLPRSPSCRTLVTQSIRPLDSLRKRRRGRDLLPALAVERLRKLHQVHLLSVRQLQGLDLFVQVLISLPPLS